MQCPYGSAVELGHKMLDEYDKLSNDFITDLYALYLMKEVGSRDI